MTKALYPGGFDPPTVGHLDIVERSARLFDEVVVGVFGRSSELFTIDERSALMTEATAHLQNVTVTQFDGLMVKYALDIDAPVVVRGLRALTDFAAEFDMAMMNAKMAPEIDQAYFMTRSRHLYISASRIRELAALKQSRISCRPTSQRRWRRSSDRRRRRWAYTPAAKRAKLESRVGARRRSVDLLELIDQLEDTVLQGRQARFGGGWTVDRALLMELIDRLRSAVPAEVEDARTILRERNDVLARSEEDAQITLAKARQEADNIVNSHDLVLDAQRRASEKIEESREQATQVLEEARGQAARVRGEATSQAVEQALEADRYSLDMLQRLDSQLAAIQTSVRAGADQLETKVTRAEEHADAEARDRAIREDSAATT